MDYAVPEDQIATRLGTTWAELTQIRRDQLSLLAGDVVAEIVTRIRPAGLDTLDPGTLDRVVSLAVAEADQAVAPGMTQELVSVDDAQMSRSFAASPTRELMHDPWWEWLGVPEVPEGSRSFSITPASPRHPQVRPVPQFRLWPDGGEW